MRSGRMKKDASLLDPCGTLKILAASWGPLSGMPPRPFLLAAVCLKSATAFDMDH